MFELSKPLQTRVQVSISQLESALVEFKNVCYANSLGPESMVLTDLIWGSVQGAQTSTLSAVEIFSIDTGRLYPETYDLIERVQQRYGRALRLYYPQAADVEGWVGANGINGFRDGIEQRRGCCAIRKVEPFRRAVAGRGAWVTGIRRAQSAGRAMAAPVAWDGEYGLHKVSPLLDWTEKEVWEYIRRKRLPYNTLHDKGFPSIGCAPCTRAVHPGDDQRSGRWWWERSESRECGLHPRTQVGFSK
ncbi:MAG: phosphoadenylyl-sulfate reductase [Pseudomonadota bacterium]|nr:phosphoadenylyl-sulfate reductase [Pseudomonadota bacterium]